jgi:hypothetical protein
MIFELTRRPARQRVAAATALVLLVGACEFRQYTILATSKEPRLVFYELDTKSLLHAQKIIKDREDVISEQRAAKAL